LYLGNQLKFEAIFSIALNETNKIKECRLTKMGLLACAISSTRKITKKILEIFYLLHLAKSLFASSIVANIKL